MTKAIEVENVSKRYKLYNSTKERLLDVLLKKEYGRPFYALSDIDFIANTGEVVGFVGINGSGKSTLSNIIAGIVPATSGTVDVYGEVSIIAVSAGLKGDLSGRENIEMKLLMLGFNKQEIQSLEQQIIDFSELGDFIDQPVKSYSSGMKSRLGFAISVNIDPDILIIDEALSVGDKAFAEKSLAKMKEFKERGKTMIFVSHSTGQMKKFCDKILWLEYGRVKEYGSVAEVMPKYEHFIREWKKLKEDERIEYRHNVLNEQSELNEEIIQSLELGALEDEEEEIFIEKPISRIVRLKYRKAFIYDSLTDMTSKREVELQRKVYYTKMLINKDGQIYYLLSEQQSAKNGVIGWIAKSEVLTHPLLFIDQDEKRYKISGTGSSFDIPWGTQEHVVIEDLSHFEDQMFHIEKTERVNNTPWYYGTLNEKKMWISERNLQIESEY